MTHSKRVLVVLRRAPTDPKTAQGLRTAVAYAAVGLEVTVALCGAAVPLLEPAAADLSAAATAAAIPKAVLRHLSTLRALERPVLIVHAAALCALVERADAVTTW